MAKRRGRPRGSKNQAQGLPESIGAALGNVAAKLDRWMAQRNEITGELNAVIDRAKSMLSSLEVTLPTRKPGRPGRPPNTVGPMHEMSMITRPAADDSGGTPPRKRRKMSAAARKKISDAQKARWAKQKKADK